MTHDYFGTASQNAPYGTPSSAPPPDPTSAQAGPRSSGAVVAIVVAGVAMCVGAIGPWIHASVYGQSFNYSGMHSQLDGRWVFALGVVVAALGIALAVSPGTRDVRAVLCTACVVIGAGGLAVVIHQHQRLSIGLGFANAVLGSFLHISVGMGWGLWLSGLGCLGAAVAGGVALLR